MTVVQILEVEDRLREQGWVYGEMPRVGSRWQHVRFPNDGFSLSDALYLEWQDALQRAGRADHRVEQLKGKLAVLLLGVLVFVIGTPSVIGLAYYFK